jgi:hypothetical protein
MLGNVTRIKRAGRDKICIVSFGETRRRARIILKQILKKLVVRMWTGYIWLRIGSNGGLL